MTRTDRIDGGEARRAAAGRRPAAFPLAAATALAVLLAVPRPSWAKEPPAIPARVIAAAAVSAATDLPAPATLRLRVEHRMDGTRIVVRLGHQAVLSAPLAALAGGPGRPHERDLSVPGGRHALTVQILNGGGRVIAQKTIDGTVEAEVPATLLVAEHLGSGDGLTLTWRTP